MKYIIYARKSTEDKKKQIQSISDQLKVLKKLAIDRGLEVLEIITDEKSAKSPGRKGFMKMVDKIQNSKEPLGIICWKLDRLARNVIDGATIIHFLTEVGKISQIATPEKNYFPEENTLLLNIEFGMATQFSRDLRKNVERGMNSKIEKGWYPSKAPWGYMNEVHALKGEKRILPHPEHFQIIKHLWKTLLKNKYTLMELYRYMEEHYPLYKKGKIIGTSTFCRVFKNKFYCGLFSWRDEWLVGAHKPMITQSQFEKAQGILTTEKKKCRKRDLSFDFKGLIKCGCCNSFVTAEEHEKFVKNTQKHEKYRYYRCGHKKKDIKCKEKPMSEPEVIKTIFNKLDEIEIPQEILDFGLRKIAQIENSQKESIKSVQIKKQITRLKQNITIIKRNLSIEEDLETRNIIKSELNKNQVKLRKFKEDLKREEEKEKKPYLKIETSLNAIKKAKNFIESGTELEKKTILRTLGSNWEINGQVLDYKGNRVSNSLKKAKKFYLAERKSIELTKNQSWTGLSVDEHLRGVVWSA